MYKVYIASPYTGDVDKNLKDAFEVYNKVLELGASPFCPLLCHFLELDKPRPYDFWIKYTLDWVGACDCVLRVGGDSKGADGEVAKAKELGIPVYYDISDIPILEP